MPPSYTKYLSQKFYPTAPGLNHLFILRGEKKPSFFPTTISTLAMQPILAQLAQNAAMMSRDSQLNKTSLS